jgi:hypothetical protein
MSEIVRLEQGRSSISAICVQKLLRSKPLSLRS